MPLDPRQLVVGDQVPGTKWVVVRLLGVGGMGAVWEVVMPPVGIRGAMKIMFPHLATRRDFVENYFNEVRLSASLNHPNIVRVTFFDELPDGTLYYIMELLVGATLRETMTAHGRPLAPHIVYEIVKQICQGLERAHDDGIVHRDLKPENVFLCKDDATVKLCDFGIAVLYNDKTRMRGVNGTPKYMSPEQFLDQRVSPRTDIYALGLMTYEMLTGRFPFELPRDSHAMREIHLKGERIRPSRYLSTLTREVDALLLSSMSANPEERPNSTIEFVNRLEALKFTPGFMPSAADVNATEPSFETLAGLAHRLRMEGESQAGVGDAGSVATVMGMIQPTMDGRSIEIAAATDPSLQPAPAPMSSGSHVPTSTVPSANVGGPLVWAVGQEPAPWTQGPAQQPVMVPAAVPKATVRLGSVPPPPPYPYPPSQPYPPSAPQQHQSNAGTSRSVPENAAGEPVVTVSRRALYRTLLLAPILAFAAIVLVLAGVRLLSRRLSPASGLAPLAAEPIASVQATTSATLLEVGHAPAGGASTTPAVVPAVVAPVMAAPSGSAPAPIPGAAAAPVTARATPAGSLKRPAPSPIFTTWGPTKPAPHPSRDDGRDLLPAAP